MATQLFLVQVGADAHRGTDNLDLLSVASGWFPLSLATLRGSGVIADTTDTITGPTAGVDVGTGIHWEFISPPVAADVTIAGTITANIWAAESSMNANVAINVVVDVIRANTTTTRNSNTVVEIGRSARTTELAVTTRAVNNFTFTPTSTVVNRGDRLRVRVWGDDSAAATMAAGFTISTSWNGTTAAADGDTYVTFTENITFESAPGSITQALSNSVTAIGRNAAPSVERIAQSFIAAAAITSVDMYLVKVGTPTDDVVVELQSDSANSPSGTVLASASVSATAISGGATDYSFALSYAVSAGVKYWLVLKRSGAVDGSNYINAHYHDNFDAYVAGAYATWTGSWNAPFASTDLRFRVNYTPTVIYLTDTASDVATASVDREAWTSRGGGVANDVTNTAAGFTSPIQVTDTAGGTVVDWFTKPLQAVTLTGMAQANIRGLEAAAAANASIRCEIARVNGDGTSPTVWASWCISANNARTGELNTSESAETCNISGDDLAITDGQRLRIRLYIDDMPTTAMGASQTVTTHYAGTSAAASGDTYITFPVTLAEFVSSTPGPASSRRQRRASRYLTFR